MKKIENKGEWKKWKEIINYMSVCVWASERLRIEANIQWKPNHTKEKRSALDAVDEGCSIEEISWDIFQLAKWMKQAESSVRAREKEQRAHYYTLAKWLFFVRSFWNRENINLCYSNRHSVRHTTLYIHFIRPFFIPVHVQKNANF